MKISKHITYLLFVLLLTSCNSQAPKDLGLSKTSQRFKECPDKKNCVSTFENTDSEFYIAPIKTNMTKTEASEKIKRIIADMPRAKLIKETPDYLRYEFTSAIFRFVDDVEVSFALPDQIHFRSASRTGYSDLGVNRKRIVHIKFQFNQNQY